MKTDVSPTPSPPMAAKPLVQPENKGFFGQIVQSVFEPGVNPSVVMAMNISFLLLIITLFGLAFLTNWNKHVVILMLVSCGFWMSMIWFVMEVSKVQTSESNKPLEGSLLADGGGLAQTPIAVEPRKDR